MLDKQVAELIAAGEVVERPSAVVKELCENAIDAGASSVTVELRHGGVTYIRVSDNGSGIAAEDVPKAFLRHATSKIASQEDLFSIATLGFRGEALASIAAMCRVELTTRALGEEAGSRYVIHGGEEVEQGPAGCPQGTTIVVRDIFYNTPARMKFLKKDVTEGAAAAAVVERLALTHPEISFRLIRDGQTKLRTPGDGKLLSAIHAVFGREVSATLIPVAYESGGVQVSGFVSKPTQSRNSRSMQNFFLNGRFVRMKTASAALEEAYKHSIMVGKFPACFLEIRIAFDRVDVNVHPAKTEVCFSDEKAVFDAVYYAVRGALAEFDAAAPRKPFNPYVDDPKVRRPVQQRFTARQYRQTVLGNEAKSGAPSQIPVAGQSAHSECLRKQPGAVPASPSSDAGEISFEDSGFLAGESGLPLARGGFVPASPAPEKRSGTVRAKREMPWWEGPGIPADSGEAQGGSFSVSGEKPDGDERVAGAAKAQSRLDVFSSSGMEGAFSSGRRRDEKELFLRKGQNLLPDEGAAGTALQPPETPVEDDQPDRFAGARLIGELFSTYLLLETKDSLLLIDKHAAHERLIFNSLLDQLKDPQPQLLLSPVVVALPKEIHAAAVERLEDFASLGIEAEDFGDGALLVRAVPALLSREDIAWVTEEVAEKIASYQRDLTPDAVYDLLHHMACRSAVMAGDSNSPLELQCLVDMLRRDEDSKYCPHGRPTAIALEKGEIERRFGRQV